MYHQGPWCYASPVLADAPSSWAPSETSFPGVAAYDNVSGDDDDDDDDDDAED